MTMIRSALPWLVRLCIATTATGSLAACYSYAEPGYVEADYIPPDVTVYPSAAYDGRTVYLVDGRWYYQNHEHWVYFREEPTVLYQERVRIQAAPRPIERQSAPPSPVVQQHAPPAYSAPYRAPGPYRKDNVPAYQRDDAPRANPPRANPQRVEPKRERAHDHDHGRR
jgi:hypothetical protein